MYTVHLTFPMLYAKILALLGLLASASAFSPTRAYAPALRAPTPAAAPAASRAAVPVAEAVPMADGAGTAAVIGGLVMILTAGIPVLFLSQKDKGEDKGTRAANLESGLRAEMGDSAFEESMMEEVDEPVAEEPKADDGDDEPKKRVAI